MRVYCVVDTDNEYGHDDLVGVKRSLKKAWGLCDMLIKLHAYHTMYNGIWGMRVIELDTEDNTVFIYHNTP